MLGMVSLAVDWGRVQAAKGELQDAADAAARYAVRGIADSTYSAKALSAASENSVDGSSMILQAGDVELGTWNTATRTFALGGASPDAIRVTARRSASRNNAVPLIFGAAIGRRSVDMASVSIATVGSAAAPDIVGLTSVTLSGSGVIKRLSVEGGTVNVASNGTFSLSSGQQIAGNVLYRGTAPSPPAGCITGTKTQMSSDVAYATPTTPGGSSPMGAINYGNGNVYAVPGGNYSATTVTLGSATLNLSGNVNLYCTGAVDVANGCVINTSNGAYKLTIYQTAASTVNFNVGTVYVRVYAPLSNVTVGGSTPLIGSIICKNLTVTGSASVSYSSAFASPVTPTGGTSGGGAVTTVR